jgi:hypothetical protein
LSLGGRKEPATHVLVRALLAPLAVVCALPGVLPSRASALSHSCGRESPWFLCDRRHSAIWVNLQSNPGGWSVWFTYFRCPVTPRGAFRVTVYQSPIGPRLVQRTVPALPRGAKQVGRTRIYRKASGSGTYTFVGRSAFNYYRFQVPARAGCDSWSMSTTTN